MFRYLALLWNAESAKAVATAEILQRRIQALSPRWGMVFRAAGATVLVADRSPHLSAQALYGGSGIVLGEIYPRLNPSEERAAVGSAEHRKLKR
jgi:hypothetical protein